MCREITDIIYLGDESAAVSPAPVGRPGSLVGRRWVLAGGWPAVSSGGGVRVSPVVLALQRRTRSYVQRRSGSDSGRKRKEGGSEMEEEEEGAGGEERERERE